MDVFFDWKWWYNNWKYNTICDKVSVDIKKTTDSEPIYNKKFLKNKIQSHDDDVTNFYNK